MLPAERSEAMRRVVLAQLTLVCMLDQRGCRAIAGRCTHAAALPRLPAVVVRVLKAAKVRPAGRAVLATELTAMCFSQREGPGSEPGNSLVRPDGVA